MPNIVIDQSLNTHLGLPDGYQLGKFEAFKIHQYMLSISGIASPMCAGRLEYYVDKHGDFVNNPKNKRDYVIKAIFDNLDKADQFSVLSYIEYWRETKGFIELDNED